MRAAPRKHLLTLLGIVLLTVVVYLPAMDAGYVWDDDQHVTANRALRSLDGLRQIWLKPRATPQYYPLVHTTFWLEYHLWGLRPLGYHLVNILLHAGNAVLVWLVLRRLGVPGAVWTALIFAVHPVHVESVVWITERKNVLSTLFYLGALLAYLRFRSPEQVGPGPSVPWRYYALAVILFSCALLGKTVACSLPAAVLLLRWWQCGRIDRRDLLATAPLFVIGTVMGLTTVYLEKYRVYAQGADWAFSAADRVLIAGRAVWFYAAKLVWPARLTFIYPRWQIDALAWWQYLFPLAAMAVVAGLWGLRRRIGRAPLVAVLFFAGTLTPALGFFNVYPMRYSFVADHFQYLASLGLIALFAAGLELASRRIGTMGRQWEGAGLGIILLLLSVLTGQQARVYHDEATLWQDTIAKNPDCWMAYGNLGALLSKQGRHQQALAYYSVALRLNPNVAEIHNNLGTTLAGQGRVEEAMAEYAEALRINPNYVPAHWHLGAVLVNRGRLDEALAHYDQAMSINPEYPGAHDYLGRLLLKQGRLADAQAQFMEALQTDPQNVSARVGLGVSMVEQGNLAEAAKQLSMALQIDPGNTEARINLGVATMRAGRYEEAVAQIKEVLRINPQLAAAHYHLGLMHSSRGRLPEARACFEEALRINPRLDAARQELDRIGQSGPR